MTAFLNHLSLKLNISQIESLDKVFDFTNSKNSEILALWLQIADTNEYSSANKAIEYFYALLEKENF